VSSTRELHKTTTPQRGGHHRPGRRIVCQTRIADCICESQQIVVAGFRILLDRESDHFPTPRRRKSLGMRVTEVIAVRLGLACQRAEDRRGISVGIGQGRGCRIRASCPRTSAGPHLPDATPLGGSIVGSAAVSGSRAAVLRRNEGTRFSSPSDDEVGGYPA
jgi:hypothetical protein